MKDINSYDELHALILKKMSGVNKLHLELLDLHISFPLQLNLVYLTLRANDEKFSTPSEEGENISPNVLVGITFINCKFKKIDCSNIEESYAFELNVVGGCIAELFAINSIFFGKFYINKQYGENKKEVEIGKFVITDSVFKENFKLHNAKINIFSIENTDFEKHADFFKSSFQKGVLPKDEGSVRGDSIGFKTTNFRGLALFGDTVFTEKLIFKYVTFESYSHFRKAKLAKGLDLDYANIQNEMNFFDVQNLDTEESKAGTSQETYRIIKHNFMKIGNKIEANKYLALELERKKVNLETEKPRNWLDYFVFKAHGLSSEFGTNWFRVFLLICLTSFLTVGSIHFPLLLELICKPSTFKQEYIGKVVGEFFQYMYILNKNDTLESHPIILLFNKVLLGYLYYQFLVSIRKNTK